MTTATFLSTCDDIAAIALTAVVKARHEDLKPERLQAIV